MKDRSTHLAQRKAADELRAARLALKVAEWETPDDYYEVEFAKIRLGEAERDAAAAQRGINGGA